MVIHIKLALSVATTGIAVVKEIGFTRITFTDRCHDPIFDLDIFDLGMSQCAVCGDDAMYGDQL